MFQKILSHFDFFTHPNTPNRDNMYNFLVVCLIVDTNSTQCVNDILSGIHVGIHNGHQSFGHTGCKNSIIEVNMISCLLFEMCSDCIIWHLQYLAITLIH